MKKLSYIGLIIFAIGIVVYIVKLFYPDFLQSIDDFFIDILWPIGLMIYGVSLIFINKDEGRKKE